MTLLLRNIKALFTLTLIITNHRIVAADESFTNGSNKTSNTPIFSTDSTRFLNDANILNNLNKTHVNTSIDTNGIKDSINGIKTELDNLSTQFNIFKIIDLFVNQSRMTVPLLATKGNFTLLQAALLCAVGSIAVGAAVIVAEAFYFKKENDKHEYNDHHQQSYYSKLPSLTYGRRNFDEQSTAKFSTTPMPKYLVDYYNAQLKRINKPQSLKRNQRRRQRKNKNPPANVLSNVFGTDSSSTKSRQRRQVEPPAGFDSSNDMLKYRPNSFNQFQYDSNSTLMNDPTQSPAIRRDDSYSNKINGNYLHPSFSGPRAPPIPIPLNEKTNEAPGGVRAKFYGMFRNAITFLLNYIFDRNGGPSSSFGSISKNEFQFPKLNRNRNFINRNFKINN